ncbi:MAG: hypothetical protein A6D91_10225 [Bacillaceae bacterium G1]|nr:MAG: hypothetical protein A6D91_10225 [Bacillaceae bacterium G1]
MGWGRNQPNAGASFSFGTIRAWPKTVAGLLLAHQGKHTPLLLIHPRRVPSAVRRYLEALNPVKPRPEPPFMHGFVLGSTHDIPFDVQVALEEQLMMKTLEH